jgi:hypothetical protein
MLVGGAGLRSVCQSLCVLDDVHEVEQAVASCCSSSLEASEPEHAPGCGGDCYVDADDAPTLLKDRGDRPDPTPIVTAVTVPEAVAIRPAVVRLVGLARAPPSPTLVSLSCRLDC